IGRAVGGGVQLSALGWAAAGRSASGSRRFMNDMSQFLACIRSGRVLLMDGAMGTELLRAGVPRAACLEALNLTQPELVQRVHRAYVDAGAQVMVTNTFQANPAHLAKHRLDHRIDAI